MDVPPSEQASCVPACAGDGNSDGDASHDALFETGDHVRYQISCMASNGAKMLGSNSPMPRSGTLHSRHNNPKVSAIRAVAVDGMRFHLPVKVGDEVPLFAALTRRGRTSLHIHVTAWRRGRHEEVSQKVTCATFAFVALDDDGRPRPLPA